MLHNRGVFQTKVEDGKQYHLVTFRPRHNDLKRWISSSDIRLPVVEKHVYKHVFIPKNPSKDCADRKDDFSSATDSQEKHDRSAQRSIIDIPNLGSHASATGTKDTVNSATDTKHTVVNTAGAVKSPKTQLEQKSDTIPQAPLEAESDSQVTRNGDAKNGPLDDEHSLPKKPPLGSQGDDFVVKGGNDQPTEGERVDALYFGDWYPAVVVSVNPDQTFTVVYDGYPNEPTDLYLQDLAPAGRFCRNNYNRY